MKKYKYASDCEGHCLPRQTTSHHHGPITMRAFIAAVVTKQHCFCQHYCPDRIHCHVRIALCMNVCLTKVVIGGYYLKAYSTQTDSI